LPVESTKLVDIVDFNFGALTGTLFCQSANREKDVPICQSQLGQLWITSWATATPAPHELRAGLGSSAAAPQYACDGSPAGSNIPWMCRYLENPSLAFRQSPPIIRQGGEQIDRKCLRRLNV
jgi:hypothetical protein